VIAVLREIIEREPAFDNVQWLTLEEFRAVY
jgi:hypothetical protein